MKLHAPISAAVALALAAAPAAAATGHHQTHRAARARIAVGFHPRPHHRPAHRAHPAPVRRHPSAPTTLPTTAPVTTPVTAPVTVPVTQCAGADLPVTSAAMPDLRAAVVCLVNQQRAQNGLPALTVSPQLDSSAQGWTDQMVATGTFAHVAGGSDPGTRVTAAGYDWWTVGENIATGYGTPRQVVAGWMASGGHCRNILSGQYTDVGTGVSAAPVSSYYASGTWTQDFGRPAGTQAPAGDAVATAVCPTNE